MNQNETIRINIDDRDIRSLNGTLAGLQSSLDDLRSTLEDSMRNVQNMTKELSPLESAVKMSSDAFKTLESGVKLTVTPLYLMVTQGKKLNPMLEASTTNLAAMKGVLNLKTIAAWGSVAAMKAMKFAMYALPIVGLVSMAISLIGVLGRLFTGTNNASDATEGYRNELDRLRSSMENTADATEESRGSFKDNMAALRRNSDTVDHHIERLARLSRETDLSNEERGQMIHSVAVLNEHIEGLNLTIDEETGALNIGIGVLRSRARVSNIVTEAIEGQAYAIEHMNDLIDEEIQLTQNLETATGTRERLTQVIEELNRMQDEGVAIFDDWHNILWECYDAEASFQQLQEDGILTTSSARCATEQLSSAMADQYEILEELNDRIYENGQTQYEVAYQISEAQRIIDIAVQGSSENQILSWDNLSKQQQSVVNELSRTFNSYVDQLRGANGKIRKNNEFTADHWREIMEHNQAVMGSWADNVDALSGRVSDEMLDYIRNLGPEHAHLVQDLVSMSDAELSDLEGVFRNNCQVAGRAALAGIDEANIPIEVANLIFESEQTVNDAIRSADFQGLGLNLAEGLRDGIKDGEILVGTGAAALAREAEEAIRRESETNSPSRVFNRIGGDLVSGLIQGIESLKAQSTNSMQQVAQHMKCVYNNANREYTNIGRDVMSGLNQGLQNGESGVMNTARRIADNVARTMRNALQINSPSRLMREQIGRQIPAGVAAGIDKYSDYALDSVYDLGKELTKVDLPNLNDIIGMGPSMSLASVGGGIGSSTHDSHVTNNNYDRLFEGANIHWHNKEDIRKTMEEIAWATQREKAQMW